MAVISIRQLLEAGVHFGHQTRRWNPKMAKYIYTSRNDIYIIDLQKTLKLVEENYVHFGEAAKTGKVLFVGTKKQAKTSVKEAAERSGQFYINERWLGGTLTNFGTIRKRVQRLRDIYEMRDNETFQRLPKKEVVLLHKEMDRLERYFLGIMDMEELPKAIFVVDPRQEEIAVKEARKLGIPVFAIVDTNCDPDEVDYVIPGNDDAIRAIRLLSNVMANAVIEANGGEVTEFLPSEDDDAVPFARRSRENTDRQQNYNKKPYNKNNEARRDTRNERPKTAKVEEQGAQTIVEKEKTVKSTKRVSIQRTTETVTEKIS